MTSAATTVGVSFRNYIHWLTEAEVPTYPGSEGTAWTAYFGGSLLRLPTHCISTPTRAELHQLFRRKYLMLSYLIEPDQTHPPNTWLYVANAATYNPDVLSKPARRDIRRAQRYLTYTPLTWDAVRTFGEAAYCETKSRLGLSENSHDVFLDYIESFSRNPAHQALGAWLESRLIAFASIVMVDDWIEIKGMFSTDADRSYCPSDGMYAYMMDRFLAKEGFRLICNGILSPQDGDGALSLHRFKLKTGFEAIPVHRVFAMPSWARPLLNPITVFSAKRLLHFRPEDHRLQKLVKALDLLTNAAPLPAETDTIESRN